MPHVSKYKLTTEERAALSQHLTEAVTALRDREALTLFFEDLLSPTERTMIGKRLAIMLLLRHELSFVEIGVVLKVSQSTISGMSEKLQRAHAALITALERLEGNRKVIRLLEKIDLVVTRFVKKYPKKVGRRWAHLRASPR